MFEVVDQKKLALRECRLDRPVLMAMKQKLDAEWAFQEMAVSGTPLARMDVRRMIDAPNHVVLRARILREAFNFHRGMQFIDRFVARSPADIGEAEVFGIHAVVVKELSDAHAARYRTDAPLEREPGQAVDASAVPTAMAEIFRWVETAPHQHAIAQATELHLKLMYIQPFKDMNARVSRLWLNLVLMQRGLPPALLGSEHRLAYGEAIARAGQDGGNALAHIIADGVERALDLCLDVVERASTPLSLERAATQMVVNAVETVAPSALAAAK